MPNGIYFISPSLRVTIELVGIPVIVFGVFCGGITPSWKGVTLTLYTSLNIGDVIPLVPVLLGEYSNIASDLTPKDCLTVPIEVSILVSTKSLALCTKLNILSLISST